MKNFSSTLILLLTTIATTSSFADNTNLVGQTKKNVKDLLKDPESAQFRNVKVVINTEGKKSVCGQVNAKNSYGGYTGFQSFYAKSNDKIVYLNDDVNYQLAGCEGKTNELKARELQKEKLLKEKEEYVNKRVNNICYLQNQFIKDVIDDRKKIDIAYNRAKQWLDRDSSLLKNFENKEYSSYYIMLLFCFSVGTKVTGPVKIFVTIFASCRQKWRQKTNIFLFITTGFTRRY